MDEKEAEARPVMGTIFLVIFIGLCGPVELFLVHSNVTQSVGLSVDCIDKKLSSEAP